jgi:hypothetical protein
VDSAGAGSTDHGRLFVALDLDHAARSALVSWRAGIVSAHPGVRPVAEDALHVTLCFLGTCAMEDVDAIAAACAVRSGWVRSGAVRSGWVRSGAVRRSWGFASALRCGSPADARACSRWRSKTTRGRLPASSRQSRKPYKRVAGTGTKRGPTLPT